MKKSPLIRSATTIACCALALMATPVNAYQAGDMILRVGAATVDPNEDSGDLDIRGVGKISGAEVGVNSDTQLGITGTWMFRDHWGIGLLAATPFEHEIDGAGSALSGTGTLADIKHLPPTLTLQAYPMSPQSRFQPYIGAGINYTIFFDEDTTSTLDGALGGKTDIDLDNSFGLAAEVGADYEITDNIVLNAALWYLDIDTEATITAKTETGTTKADIDVDIDPWVYMVGIGYKF